MNRYVLSTLVLLSSACVVLPSLQAAESPCQVSEFTSKVKEINQALNSGHLDYALELTRQSLEGRSLGTKKQFLLELQAMVNYNSRFLTGRYGLKIKDAYWLFDVYIKREIEAYEPRVLMPIQRQAPKGGVNAIVHGMQASNK